MVMTSQFVGMMSSLDFFNIILCLFSSLVNDPSFIWILSVALELWQFSSFIKGLTRNPEIRNTLIWVLPDIWRLEWLGDTKFGTNASNKMLLNARVAAFTVSELLRGTQERGLNYPSPPRIPPPPPDYG